MKITLNQAAPMLKDYLLAGLVPILKGSPGLGKSAVIHALAKDLNLKVIDLRLAQCDPTDLLGFVKLEKDSNGNMRGGYAPMEMFPIENDPLPIKTPGIKAGTELPDGTIVATDIPPTFYSGWLLFLDEITSAKQSVQAASYKLILDRMVGLHKLHDCVFMVGAGNLETDNAIVEEMSTAIKSRMVHMELQAKPQDFIEYALQAGFDYRITAYLQYKPESFYTFKPDAEDPTYACPRTWEFADRLLKLPNFEFNMHGVNLICGAISEGVGRDFSAFAKLKDDLPLMSDIIAKPTVTPVPQEISVIWMLTGALAHHVDKASFDPILQYIKRLPLEFQVVSLRQIMKKDASFISHPEMSKWFAENNANLH